MEVILKRLFAYSQYVTPQHLLSNCMGKLADSKQIWLKNALIKTFAKLYQVDMSEAKNSDLTSYASFNDFFIRELKSDARPITPELDSIAAPADGSIAQIGSITEQKLLQAKGIDYTLDALFANDASARLFDNGSFATIYLAPYNYHRVHMPLSGKLTQSTYVPGKLFSVNRTTSQLIPNLYGINERLINVFDTEAGPMAVILVGAMIVGSIQPAWLDKPASAQQIPPSHSLTLAKGQELGYFKLGSTVILLFADKKVAWSPGLEENSLVKMGECLGKIHF